MYKFTGFNHGHSIVWMECRLLSQCYMDCNCCRQHSSKIAHTFSEISILIFLSRNTEPMLPKTDLQHFWVTRVKFVFLKDYRCLQASKMAEISFSRRPLVFYPNFSQTQFLLYFILSRHNLISFSILVIFGLFL